MALIFLLLMGWMYFTMPSPDELRRQAQERQLADSLAALQQVEQADPNLTQVEPETFVDSQTPKIYTGNLFSNTEGDTLDIVVENEFYTAVFSTKGGGPRKIILNKYKTWDDQPVQLIADTTRSAYNLGFISTENLNVETRNLLFQTEETSRFISLDNQSRQLRFNLPVDASSSILYTYTFFPDSYEIDLDIQFLGGKHYVAGGNVEFGWKSRLSYTEKSRVAEGTYSSAIAYSGGEIEKLLLSESGRKENILTGRVSWVASRTHFFTQIIKPLSETDGAVLTAEVSGTPSTEQVTHAYTSALRHDIPESNSLAFEMFAGPIRYRAMKKFEDTSFEMVDMGYAIFRWFSEPLTKYVFIYYFDIVAPFIGNYGLAVILLALLVKLILSPLTHKSFKSMAAMKELAPKMKELQDKFKNDPQKLQQATMKLYKEEGVNPLGGCLPNLLQLPILVTLWTYFQSSIEIRQQAFLWANDLSAPDFIINLPFDVPFLGSGIGGFVLLMTVSMVGQMQVSGQSATGGAAAAQAKMMQYLMPVMMFFFFNHLSAGLNLYYFTYNLVSMGHQLLINRQVHQENEEQTQAQTPLNRRQVKGKKKK